jgi:putative ABC transport system substrate-binding protein
MIRGLLALVLATLLGCLAPFGLTSAADPQQPASPRRIGVLLGTFSPDGNEAQQFRQGLLDAGYVEGRDVVLEWRSAGGDVDRLPGLAADLVQRKVDVIVAVTTLAAKAAKRATSTIPIVIAVVADPVGVGLVTNLAHPGGNITGLSLMNTDLTAKRLQLLKEVISPLTRIAVLGNPDAAYYPNAVNDLKSVAPSLGMGLSFVEVRTPEEIAPAFAAVSRAHAQALYVIDSVPLFNHRPTLLRLASKARLPAVYYERRWADEGGLISYGANYGDSARRAAGYVDKILKGAKPGDLPIEQPTKFECVVNLKTAKALGITIPESVLLRANEVIR